jgi:DNA-binding MarR family transcriptional regulator
MWSATIMPKSTSDDAGRYAYDGLDRVLHEKARLGIMTSLITRPDGLVFGELKSLCNLTDGNLSRHLDVLSKEGLVKIDKAFVANRPQTTCRVTSQGRKRFREYLTHLEKVLRDAQVEEAAPKTNRGTGWAPA